MTEKEKALKIKVLRAKITVAEQACDHFKDQLNKADDRWRGLKDELNKLELVEVEDVAK